MREKTNIFKDLPKKAQQKEIMIRSQDYLCKETYRIIRETLKQYGNCVIRYTHSRTNMNEPVNGFKITDPQGITPWGFRGKSLILGDTATFLSTKYIKWVRISAIISEIEVDPEVEAILEKFSKEEREEWLRLFADRQIERTQRNIESQERFRKDHPEFYRKGGKYYNYKTTEKQKEKTHARYLKLKENGAFRKGGKYFYSSSKKPKTSQKSEEVS